MPRPKLIFSDFDGTLTHGSEFRPEFLEILSFLKSKEIPLVICTGRSKSWAHFLLTHFSSLEHVISEGGGVLTSARMVKGRRVLKDQLLISPHEVKRLGEFTKELLGQFSRLQLSVDSFGRETDRAIELSDLKDDPELDGQVRKFLESHRVNYSTSNVHLNFWCGEISKMKSLRFFMSEVTYVHEDEVIFFGDSLNDETVFEGLRHCVGVSNIQEVLDQLQHRPRIILEGSKNEGPMGVLNYLKSII